MSLYIPKKIKVGFQERKGTYTGKLAYIIYFDDKGVLRKEKSWEGWRDKKIEPVEFDNVPTAGFCLNKDIKRYSDWGNNRTVIRIYDPRDFEFEITTDNLIGILMHTDCLKRGLEGEFVYAWNGTELVLLPTCSQEYQDALVFTGLQAEKVAAKDLKLGFSYLTKKQETLIYLGRFTFTDKYSKVISKRYVFWNPYYKDYTKKVGRLEFLSGVSSLAKVSSSSEVVDEYTKGLDAANKEPQLYKIKSLKLEPVTDHSKIKTYDHLFLPYKDGKYLKFYFYRGGGGFEYNFYSDQFKLSTIDCDKVKCSIGGAVSPDEVRAMYPVFEPLRYYTRSCLSFNQIKALPLFRLVSVLESGGESPFYCE